MYRRTRSQRASHLLSTNSGSGRSALVMISALVVAFGCGKAEKHVARIQGVVTIDGQPLPADAMANVSFRPTLPGQGRAAGATVVGGKFDCRDAPLGKVKVYIDVQRVTGRMIQESDGVPFREVRSIISPKYGSGIDLEITGDDDSQDFDLDSSSS